MNRRQPRGAAVVETVVASGLALVVMTGALFVGRLALAVRRADALARHAAALEAADVPPDVVRAETDSYAAALGERMTLSMGRFTGSPSAAFYRLAEAVVTVERPRPSAWGSGTVPIVGRAVLEEEP